MLGCYAWSSPQMHVAHLFDGLSRDKDLILADLFEVIRKPGGVLHIMGTRGMIVRNSVMWRKSVHDQLGGFLRRPSGGKKAEGQEEGCSAFLLWLEGLKLNLSIRHLAEPPKRIAAGVAVLAVLGLLGALLLRASRLFAPEFYQAWSYRFRRLQLDVRLRAQGPVPNVSR
jgi:hypothetical protein